MSKSFFFTLTEVTLKYKVIQTKLAYLVSIFFQCSAKVSDYQAVGLSNHRIIDALPL